MSQQHNANFRHPAIVYRRGYNPSLLPQVRPPFKSVHTQVRPKDIPDLMHLKAVETERIDTSSTGTQCVPAHTDIESGPSGTENISNYSEEQKQIWMRIGQKLCGIEPENFPMIPTKKYTRNSGEEIVRNVNKVMCIMRQALGDDAKYTFLSDNAFATSKICGIGRATVFRRTPEKEEPPRKLLRDMSRKERCRKYVGEIGFLKRAKIIDRIHTLWKNGKDIVTDELWKWAKSNLDNQKSIPIFLQVLRGLGFVYKKKDHNTIVEERPDIIQKRAKYLQLKEYWDSKNALFASFDETWGHDGMSKRKAWQHANSTLYKRSRMMDLESPQAGPNKGKEKGKRVIIAALLTEFGVIPGTELLLVSGVREEDQTQDYHRDMNAANFERYYKTFIPLFAQEAKKLGRPAVLLTDNAPYHNVALKKPPTSISSKAEVKEFLREHGLRFFEKQNRDVLYDLAKNYVDCNGGREEFTVYKFDEFAKSHGVTVLRLPQYHCYFNPIELLWSQLKQHLRKEGTPQDSVKNRALAFLRAFSHDSSAKLFSHTLEWETDIREMTRERDLTVEDTDFELLYDVSPDGTLRNIHLADDDDDIGINDEISPSDEETSADEDEELVDEMA